MGRFILASLVSLIVSGCTDHSGGEAASAAELDRLAAAVYALEVSSRPSIVDQPVAVSGAPEIGTQCLIYLADTALLESVVIAEAVDKSGAALSGRLDVLNEEWIAVKVSRMNAVLWIPRSNVAAVVTPL